MRQFLLGTSSLMGALLGAVLLAPQALAACSTTSPTTGQTVFCGGIESNPVIAGPSQNNVTINVQDGAQITWNAGGAAIQLNDSSAVNMVGSGKILTSGSGGGIALTGDFGQISLSGTSGIGTTGNGADGIDINGSNSLILIGGASFVASTGDNANSINLAGSNNAITNAGSIIATGIGADAITFNGPGNISNSGIIESFHGAAINADAGAGQSIVMVNTGQILGSVALGSGDDTLTLGTGSYIEGVVDAGAGTDTLTLTGSGNNATAAYTLFSNFEHLAMSGTSWRLLGSQSFSQDAAITAGRLDVDGTLTAPNISIGNSGTLAGTGTLVGDVTSTGTIAAGNLGDTTTGTLHITGNLTQTGGGFLLKFNNAGFDQVNVTGTVTLNNAPTVTLAPINGATGASGVLLHAGGGITGSLGNVIVQGNGAAVLTQSQNDVSASMSLLSIDGSAAAANAFAASETGLDMLDTVTDEQSAGIDDCDVERCSLPGPARRHLWAKSFGHFGSEGTADGDQPFDYRIAGAATGADFHVADGFRLGLAGLYGNTEETVSGDAADSDINTALAAVYANYQLGRFFLTGAVSGGWQGFDLTRQVATANGSRDADATTHGWLIGTNLQAGMRLQFPNNWRLTPSIGASYQHQWINGYEEHGAGTGDVSAASQQADALRLKAQLQLARDYQLDQYTITPHLSLGLRQQYNFGGKANGTFSDGTDFSLDLKDDSRTAGLVGVGVQVAFASGLSTYVDYDGALAGGRTAHAVTGGMRYSW